MNKFADDWFDKWAAYVQRGGECGYKSIMSLLIETKGHLVRSARRVEPNTSSFELAIEIAVCELATKNQAAATVLRVEYGAKVISSLPPNPTQNQKALKLNMSLRTYHRRLRDAKNYVYENIKR
jgi:hypothetical protein